MPFTPAHPAIILPFLRSRYLSATALIIGSVSPDFEYFFKMSVSGEHGHTVAGLFYFDLPVTILLALVFHLAVKKNLIGNLPLFFQRRLQELLRVNFVKGLKRNAGTILVSACLGAASHILWDGFTHNNTYFVRTLPIYEATYIPYDGVRYPLFYALQHISTAIGLAIVVIFIALMKPSKEVTLLSAPKATYWLMVMSLTSMVVWIRFSLAPTDLNLGNVVVSTITGFLSALICCGFVNFKNSSIHQQA